MPTTNPNYTYLFSSPGRTSSAQACAEMSFTHTMYSSSLQLDFGQVLHNNYQLSSPVGGGDLWYQYGVDGISYQINNSGVIIGVANCVDDITPTPNIEPVITIVNYDSGCINYTITGGTITNGINLLISTNGTTWTSSAGSAISPRCGIIEPTVTTWFRLQSLDTLSNYSNVYVYEVVIVEPTIVPTEILLAKSPQFINYSDEIDYTKIVIKLFIWNGLFVDIPTNPNNTFTVFKTSATTYLNIQPYLVEHLNPKPNSTYFTNNDASDFGEFVNLKYIIEVFNDEILVDTISDKSKLATLGYGRHFHGANPHLTPSQAMEQITIDTTVITIDTTLITLDFYNLKKFFDNKNKFHPQNTRVYSGFFNDEATGSNNLIVRKIEADFKLTCSGKYTNRHIMYQDKNGLFDTFSFSRASSQFVKSTIGISNRLNTTPYDYNQYEHNQKVDKTGKVNWVFNTDNLTEINGEYLTDLFFSDTFYLIDYENENFIPLVLVDTDFEPKTAIKDKGKQQYTFKFSEAN
jgi:hypothetical protein